MSVRVLRCALWLPHDHSVLSHIVTRQSLGRPGLGLRCEEPVRPEGFPAGTWRRMSRLARAVAQVCAELLQDQPRDIPVVWGSAVGELGPTGRFLDKLLGPDRASPLNFQNSVYNAPIGHLSIALGLTGHTETLVAGAATGTAVLERGLILARRHGRCLLVAGDDLTEGLEAAHLLNGTEAPLGECVAAVLLHTGDEGPEVQLSSGYDPVPGRPVLRRQTRFPGEPELEDHPGTFPPEQAMGLNLSNGLGVIAALALADRVGGSLVEQDLQRLQTARVLFPSDETRP